MTGFDHPDAYAGEAYGGGNGNGDDGESSEANGSEVEIFVNVTTDASTGESEGDCITESEINAPAESGDSGGGEE
jgi:hypothetical protein